MTLTQFAPYAPPPDERQSAETSYQFGGVPTFGYPNLEQQDSPQNVWETRLGYRVELEAASCYILGPITALLMLIFETENDFVRFHAYQSALLTTPPALVLLLLSLATLPTIWLMFLLLGTQIYMAVRAYVDTSRGPQRFLFPLIGRVAEQWLAEE